MKKAVEIICGNMFLVSFVGILIAIFGMIWFNIDYKDYLYPRLLITNIIICWLSHCGWIISKKQQ